MSDQVIERWSWIPGYEGRYEVSDMGNVRSFMARGPGSALRKHPIPKAAFRDRKGRRVVNLTNVGPGLRRYFVHVLVLSAFVGPRPDGHHGAHHNDDHDDDRLANLAWKLPGDNYIDRNMNGRTARGERCGAYKHGKYVGRKNPGAKYVSGLQVR